MIEIIKHGNLKKIQTCFHCQCEFSYEYEDIKTVQSHMNEYRDYICCPECGAELDVNKYN